MVDEGAASDLAGRLKAHGSTTRVLSGQAALCDVAAHPEAHSVMAAIVGAAGLAPTMAAVRAGKRILLANKEALVMSGAFFMEAVREHGAELLPIDSEHNAIFQCLPVDVQRQPGFCDLAGAGISKILLTGSGGPFRYADVGELHHVTPAQAIAHPNWSMGAKISVDSATMMNKGLEYIEARWLFNAAPEQIQVVIHPQSVIHSMVQYKDGSVLAQLGNPDMCTPIAHALAYPERIESGVEPLDFFSVGEFSFIRPDYERYPCLALAMSACQQGRGRPPPQCRQRGGRRGFSCRADRIYGYCQSQRIRHGRAGQQCCRLSGGSHRPGRYGPSPCPATDKGACRMNGLWWQPAPLHALERRTGHDREVRG